MFELKAHGPFDQLAAPPATAEAAVWARPVDCGFASVLARRGAATAVAERAQELFGAAPPHGPRRSGAPPLAWIGTGPGAWLAVLYPQGPTVAELRAGLEGLASVVDQSGGYGLVQLGGPRAADLLGSGVFLDLHPQAFPPGSAAGTVLAHVSVTVWRVSDELFEIAVPRSFAPAIVHWLQTAGAEFGLA